MQTLRTIAIALGHAIALALCGAAFWAALIVT